MQLLDGEVTGTAVRDDGDDDVPGAHLRRNLQGGIHVGAAGKPRHHSFFPPEAPRGGDSFLVSHLHYLIGQAHVHRVRDEAFANALNPVVAGLAAGDDGRAAGLH